MSRILDMIAKYPELEKRFLAGQEQGGELEQALATMGEQAPNIDPADIINPTTPTADRLTSAIAGTPQGGSESLPGGGGLEESATPRVDHLKEYLDNYGSTGNRIMRGIGRGLSGYSGSGVGEILTAEGTTFNTGANRARAMNLTDPASQISQQFRDLARMYSDPKEFPIDDGMSADAIVEAMPWLAKKIGLDQSQMRAYRGGGGGGKKLRPLGEKPLDAISTNQSLQEQLKIIKGKIQHNPDLINKVRALKERGLSVAGLQDPEWAALNTEIGVLRNYIARAIQGGVLSDRDNALYERIVTGVDATPETVISVLDSLGNTAQAKTDAILDAQERGGRDVSGFRGEGLSGTQDNKKESDPKAMIRFEVNGRTGAIPADKVKAFMKKNPNAKRIK